MNFWFSISDFFFDSSTFCEIMKFKQNPLKPSYNWPAPVRNVSECVRFWVWSSLNNPLEWSDYHYTFRTWARHVLRRLGEFQRGPMSLTYKNHDIIEGGRLPLNTQGVRPKCFKCSKLIKISTKLIKIDQNIKFFWKNVRKKHSEIVFSKIKKYFSIGFFFAT